MNDEAVREKLAARLFNDCWKGAIDWAEVSDRWQEPWLAEADRVQAATKPPDGPVR